MKKWTENERDYRRKKKKTTCVFVLFVDWSFFPNKIVCFSSFYCVDDDDDIELFVDVGVIVAAHDNFLGITVSGVGISWPVIVSGTIGDGDVASLLLLVLLVGSGLLAANLPCDLATL